MARPPRDEEREERITMEIIVDAYGADEQALGWYYYLEEHLAFPFRARCIAERSISPLRMMPGAKKASPRPVRALQDPSSAHAAPHANW